MAISSILTGTSKFLGKTSRRAITPATWQNIGKFAGRNYPLIKTASVLGIGGIGYATASDEATGVEKLSRAIGFAAIGHMGFGTGERLAKNWGQVRTGAKKISEAWMGEFQEIGSKRSYRMDNGARYYGKNPLLGSRKLNKNALARRPAGHGLAGPGSRAQQQERSARRLQLRPRPVRIRGGAPGERGMATGTYGSLRDKNRPFQTQKLTPKTHPRPQKPPWQRTGFLTGRGSHFMSGVGDIAGAAGATNMMSMSKWMIGGAIYGAIDEDTSVLGGMAGFAGMNLGARVFSGQMRGASVRKRLSAMGEGAWSKTHTEFIRTFNNKFDDTGSLFKSFGAAGLRGARAAPFGRGGLGAGMVMGAASALNQDENPVLGTLTGGMKGGMVGGLASLSLRSPAAGMVVGLGGMMGATAAGEAYQSFVQYPQYVTNPRTLEADGDLVFALHNLRNRY